MIFNIVFALFFITAYAGGVVSIISDISTTRETGFYILSGSLIALFVMAIISKFV